MDGASVVPPPSLTLVPPPPPTLFHLAAAHVNWEELPECIAYRLYNRARAQHRDHFQPALKSAARIGRAINDGTNEIPFLSATIPPTNQNVLRFWTDMDLEYQRDWSRIESALKKRMSVGMGYTEDQLQVVDEDLRLVAIYKLFSHACAL